MSKPKVVTYAGLTVNLAEVKCFRLSSLLANQKNYNIIVEFKTRYDYIFNPNTKKSEKQEYNETAVIEFTDSELANAYLRDWESIWQEYLSEQE